MGKIRISIIDVNKDTKLEDFWYDFTARKIITTLHDMQEDATIIRIERYECTQEEKLAIVKNICDIYDSAPGSFVICADVYVGTKELPPEKYYDPGFGNFSKKKPLPVNEIFDRERKMYSELGFVSIYEVLEYSYWDTMIYTNDIGRRLINHWFGETEYKEREDK